MLPIVSGQFLVLNPFFVGFISFRSPYFYSQRHDKKISRKRAETDGQGFVVALSHDKINNK